jgi:glyoxylase-like metal-dependent hydrolase (beta-lactamase superfamily II)
MVNEDDVRHAFEQLRAQGLPGYSPPPRPWQDRWRELAAGVLVRRHQVLDLNVTLVLGDELALVVDTHSHAGYARALVEAVRQVTALPWVVLDTHAHFDHCFGNATFRAEQPGLDIWGHEGCVANLVDFGDLQRRVTAQEMREAGREEDAEAVEAVEIVPPNRTFTDDVTLDLGGRTVVLHHPGRGHTDHDAVVEIADAAVTVAGDLVEEGAAPSFGDGFPLEWATTLTRLLPRLGSRVVPGHGDVVDPGFVAEQRDHIAEIARVARTLPADPDDLTLARAAARLRIGRDAGFAALRRAVATR